MGKRILSIMMLLVVAMMLISCKGKPEVNEEVGVVEDYIPVEITTVKSGDIFNTITLTGKVHGSQEVMVIPTTPGEVEKVFVGIGDKVIEEQELFSLNKEDIQKQVDTAKEQKQSAYSNYLSIQESNELAKATYARMLELYKKNGIPKSQLEQAELQASSAPMEAAKSQYDMTVLALNNAEDLLADTKVKSPIKGIVTGVNIEPGEKISTGSPALSVVDMEKVYIELNITENIINELSIGQSVSVEIDALEKEYRGTIDRISPVADSRTNLYQTKVYLDNDDFSIKPGMFTKVFFNIDFKENVVKIPSEAVITSGNKNYVYIASGDMAKQSEVNLGIDSGMFVEVIKGVNDGDKLVVKGQQYIKDGSNIKVVRGDK